MNCQDHLYRHADPRQVTRRWFLEQCGVGLGAITLRQLNRCAKKVINSVVAVIPQTSMEAA